MLKRYPLRKLIVDAWNSCIEQEYSSQRINSERSLQAAFWSKLNDKLPPNRRLFVEPPVLMTSADGEIKKTFPDIVICSDRKIIAVVELKYLPKWYPVYHKDIDTLTYIANCKDHIEISNRRYEGHGRKPPSYSLAKSVLLVWAGIHRTPRNPDKGLFIETSNELLNDSYFQINTITDFADKPVTVTLDSPKQRIIPRVRNQLLREEHVIVERSSKAVKIFVCDIVWPHPHEPQEKRILAVTLKPDASYQKIDKAIWDLLNTRKYFQVCDTCGEKYPSGHMFARKTCMTCAEQADIVF